MRFRPRLLASLALLLIAPALGSAYGTRVHRVLARCALGPPERPCGEQPEGRALPGISDLDLSEFRAWLFARAAAVRDTALRRRFRARYPSERAFDERAMKEFLMMNGEARVLGVDSFAAVYRAAQSGPTAAVEQYRAGSPITPGRALELGSVFPDLDRRNQNRLLRDRAGTLVRSARGDSVPFDPISLNMGRLTGLSSQAHAHYALDRHPKSSDPEVLRRTPWDFAVPIGYDGPVETFAAENAQLYTDLALLAALNERPSGRALGALYAGAAMHYLGDAGNAIHTVQVGIYEIFRDATVRHWTLRARNLFGLLGATRSRNAIGLDIITSLHTLSERLFEVELAPHPVTRGDDSLAGALGDTLALLRRAADSPDFGRAFTALLTDAGIRDGAGVYRATRAIASEELTHGVVAVDFDTVPDDQLWRWLRVRRGDPALDAFNAVESRSLARSVAALRAWWAEYQRELSMTPPSPGWELPPSRATLIDDVVTRLVRERLRYLEAAEARRNAWIAAHGGLAP